MNTASLRSILRFAIAVKVLAVLSTLAMPVRGAEGLTKYPVEYVKLLQEAARTYYSRDFDETLAALTSAEQMLPPSPTTLNIRAAVAIERRDYEEGAQYCKEALKLDPEYFAAKYNLGEIPFLEKKYPEARAIYEAIPDGTTQNDLKQYKIYLTYLLTGDDKKAGELLALFKFPANTGAYYYAHGAWEYVHGNKEKALDWVRAGNWVFSADRNIDYAGVFFDLGWLDRPAPVKRSRDTKTGLETAPKDAAPTTPPGAPAPTTPAP